MTEFNKSMVPDDETWKDSQRHLQAVFEEYPFMKPFYFSMKNMVADETEWRLTAADIKDYENDPDIPIHLKRDPDYLNKYKFLWGAAIADNTSIPVELRQELIGVIFSDEKDQGK